MPDAYMDHASTIRSYVRSVHTLAQLCGALATVLLLVLLVGSVMMARVGARATQPPVI